MEWGFFSLTATDEPLSVCTPNVLPMMTFSPTRAAKMMFLGWSLLEFDPVLASIRLRPPFRCTWLW